MKYDSVSSQKFMALVYVCVCVCDQTGEDAKGEDGAAEQVITAEDLQREADILSRLAPHQIQQVMDEVLTDVLGNLQVEVMEKLREQENSFINRINKLHKTA